MDKKQISLRKGKDYFVFRYTVGDELNIWNAMLDLAYDGHSEFDIMDFIHINCNIQFNECY